MVSNKETRSNGLRAAWLLAAAFAACAAGCGEGRSASSATFYPVSGKVILPDGKPLAGANVVFLGPYSATVHTEADGTFRVKGEKEGLPEGEYQVRLEVAGTKSASRRATTPFPSRYLDEDASGLKANVTPAGPNDFEFKLTKDAGGLPATGTGKAAKANG